MCQALSGVPKWHACERKKPGRSQLGCRFDERVRSMAAMIGRADVIVQCSLVLACRPEGRPMRSRSFIWLGVLVGSTIGSLIPELWGGDTFSYSSVLLSGVGALVGLWIGFKMSF